LFRRFYAGGKNLTNKKGLFYGKFFEFEIKRYSPFLGGNTKTFDKSWRTNFVPFFSIKQGTKYVHQDLSKFLYCDLTLASAYCVYHVPPSLLIGFVRFVDENTYYMIIPVAHHSSCKTFQ
jgi:hypothetical protein